MKAPKASLLLHPAFLTSLLLLLLNDFSWKFHYHNWLTGKLSDVTGMLVLPVFCRVLFPTLSNRIVFLFCAAFFTWWKSSYSQAAIDFINTFLRLPVHRVVDSSDLLALFVLPLGLTLQPKACRLQPVLFYGLRSMLALVTIFSLCSTSVYRPLFMAHPDSNDIYFHETWTQEQNAAAVLQTLQAKRINFRVDSVMYYPVLNQRDLYYRQQLPTDSFPAWQQVSQAPDSTLFIRREGTPYYLIPDYRAQGAGNQIHFQNIRFTLSENKKKTKTKITVETFASPGLRPYAIMDRKTRKAYKEALEKLFSEE
jgi:hypothetical protein